MKKKNGISLIVLVITIIVMIILAATVVISLNNTGIIDKATHAVNLSDQQSVQDMAALIWAECYLDGDRDDTLVQNVTTKLEQNNIKAANWNISVSNSGVVVSLKDGIQIITFTIEEETFQAEEGMTWEEFVASKYNTKNFGIFEDVGTVINIEGREVTYKGIAVPKTEKIVANEAYKYSSSLVPC